MKFTAKQIAQILEGEIEGNPEAEVSRLSKIEEGINGSLTFLSNPKYNSYLYTTKASVAIVNHDIIIEKPIETTLIKVKNADLAMAKLLDAFTLEAPYFSAEIHPSAIVDVTAKIGNGSRVGAGCYVGKDVVLGANVTLYPNVTILDETTIGDDTTVWSGTVIRERSVIGSHCIFHTNVSIGADGFGYRPSDDGRGLVKIPHIGNVVIGNGVEIGANSCVDRAKFSSTIVGDGCKIDNLVQIAHNCVLGRFCIMAGSSGLAGSVTLGDGVIIGGSASIKDHTTIHSGATVGAGSGVMNDVAAGKTVLGYPAVDSREMLKQWVALRKLAR